MSEANPFIVAGRELTDSEMFDVKRIIVGVMTRAKNDAEYEGRLRADAKGVITEYASRLSAGELSDEELEAVAGGDELWAIWKYAAKGAGYLYEGAKDVAGAVSDAVSDVIN